ILARRYGPLNRVTCSALLATFDLKELIHSGDLRDVAVHAASATDFETSEVFGRVFNLLRFAATQYWEEKKKSLLAVSRLRTYLLRRDVAREFKASSAESVGRFWFRESSQVVIKGNFHSLVGTKAVGSSGNHSDFVVETLNGAIGDFSFGSKPIQDQRLMGAQHPGHLFHRFQTATHGPGAPIVEKATGPDHGFVVPEIGEGLLQIPGPCGGQLAGQQGIELLPNPPAYPAAAA